MNILLIGAGNMGKAMIPGLQNYNLTVVEKNIDRAKNLQKLYPNIKIVNSSPNIDDYIVILAIKPQSLNNLQLIGKAKALISILAGTTLERLKEIIDAKYYIRAMPNVAAMNQKSITSITGDLEFKDRAIEILSSIGKTVWLNNQKELDIATGLAASSPAWLAIVAEALADGAVNLGLPRDKALEYLGGLFEGVASLLEEKHPALIKDMVASPGGTTIAGLKVLEDRAIRSAFIQAMEDCYNRAKNI